MAEQTRPTTTFADRLRGLWGKFVARNDHPRAAEHAEPTEPLDPRLWDDIVEIGRRVPPDERAREPTDAARNFDHYVDGVPKQD